MFEKRRPGGVVDKSKSQSTLYIAFSAEKIKQINIKFAMRQSSSVLSGQLAWLLKLNKRFGLVPISLSKNMVMVIPYQLARGGQMVLHI